MLAIRGNTTKFRANTLFWGNDRQNPRREWGVCRQVWYRVTLLPKLTMDFGHVCLYEEHEL